MCLELVLDQAGVGWPQLSGGDGPTGRFDREECRRSLAAAVAAVDVAVLGVIESPDRLLPGLIGCVDSARYWQEPDAADQLLADPALAAELGPVAEAVAEAPASRWWAGRMAADGQHAVAWRGGDPAEDDTPRLTSARRSARFSVGGIRMPRGG
jgi:hypothetical protein